MHNRIWSNNLISMHTYFQFKIIKSIKIEEESFKKSKRLKNENAIAKIIRPHCGEFVNFFAYMKKRCYIFN